MSARESSETFAIVLSPTVALVNQLFIYLANSWTCGRNMQYAAHAIPALAMIIIIGSFTMSYRRWRAIGGGVADEGAAEETRVRFLTFIGMGVDALSGMVVLAQWAAIFAFDPCMRA